MRRNPHQSPDKSQVYSPKSFMQSGMNKLHQHVGVQFSYLVPMSAHLRGVHVVGEKLFEISGEFPQLLEWEEYGLRIQVPEGATSEPCDIAIKAIVAGQLEFPEGTDLVSAVYAISVSKRLAKSVMLEIQHCAAITREEQGRFLSFVRAQCNQPQLPYQFELLDNGTFSPHSYYGKIACDRFSLIAAIRRFISQRGSRVGHISQVPVTDQVMKRSPTEQPSTVHFFPDVSTPDKKSLSVDKLSLNEATPVNESTSSLSIVDGSALPSMEYIAFMFHINKARNSWVWHFNVTKDLNALKQHVKKEHSRWDGGSYFQFAFHKQELQLELKEENFHQGWRIMPADYPCMLHKSIVDAYKDSSPPCCQVKVKASEGSGDINYPVPVLGITPAKKVFIQLDYQTTDPFLQLQTPPEHTPRRLSPLEKLPKQSDLLNQVAANASNEWENLGLQLDIKYHQLETLADKHRNNVSRFAEMFELWRKRGSPPYTWATIIDALRAKIVGNISLANDLEQWVINNYA